jgi:predicted nucleotidyltransferase
MSTLKIDFQTEQAIRSFASKLAEQYHYISVILFGSRARHTHRPDSDAARAALLSSDPFDSIRTYKNTQRNKLNGLLSRRVYLLVL